ncbi:winged helix-turn-helix domain-containing protein [Vibrio sp. IB15]|uniref:winged helix-turn-helix domain-containing protein n=1 Tax=Vibrio sp. IB15 TaxID=2779368 RepID=UPI001E625A21|nr:winged helix-turn-helix domain-containing protein [Vibrio sp. IB15]
MMNKMMNVTNSLVIYEKLHVNFDDRSIMNIEDKSLIQLRPKPFRVLLYLHQHSNRCVSKDEIFDECWDGSIVSDQSLTNTISMLRKALLTINIRKIKITTISKAGYRLDKIYIDDSNNGVSNPTPLLNGHNNMEVNHDKEFLKTRIYKKFQYKLSLVKNLILSTLPTAILLMAGDTHGYNIPNQRLVSNVNTEYTIIDKTKNLDLDSIEAIIKSRPQKKCNAKSIKITINKGNEVAFETDFSIKYKNNAYNNLYAYRVKKDNFISRMIQISTILSLCKLNYTPP